MRLAGENAMEDLYLSWEESVARAAARYRIVMEKSASGEYERQRRLTDGLIHATANVMEGVELIKGFRECPREELHAMYQWQKAHFGRLTDQLWQKIYIRDRKD